MNIFFHSLFPVTKVKLIEYIILCSYTIELLMGRCHVNCNLYLRVHGVMMMSVKILE